MKLITLLMISAGIIAPGLAHAAIPAAGAKTTSQAGTIKVTSVEGITEYKLPNGLRVVLFPDASKPTITTNIIYMVGSRHENYGETGMAHLLEHLLFKPSANFGVKKGSKTPVEILNETGSEFNGTTWYDRTNYYATFPAKEANLKLMLALEADRMVNAAIDQNDLWNPKTQKGEMTVVRNEFEIGENDPVGVTTERIQAVAFDWHNYGKSTIGARSDIEQVNIPRLRAFYKKYYQPDNAMLMVAGRFDEAKILKQVEQVFGRIPKPNRVIDPTYTAEPTQDGERAVTVRRNGGTQYLGVGYHAAPSAHIDAVALNVLGRILVSAPSGRLHKALVETKLATELDYNPVSNLEPGYRIFGAIVPKEVNLDQTQAVMLKVLEDIKSNPITEEEVNRAKQRMLTSIDKTSSQTASLTIALTESMAAGDWRLFFLQRDQLSKITAAEVQAAAIQYLKPTNRTLGQFIPTETADRTAVPKTPDIAATVSNYQGRPALAQGEAFDSSPKNIEARTQRLSIAGGMQVALLAKKTKGAMVDISLQIPLGTEASLMNQAQVGQFANELLLMGSAHHNRQEIKDSFDQLGAIVMVGGNSQGLNASLSVKRENLNAALALLAEVIKTPSFPSKEFEEYQRVAINQLEQAKPEPQEISLNAYSELYDATPVGHVNHASSFDDQIAAAKAINVDAVKNFHAKFFGTDKANFAAVGDFDAAQLQQQLETLFGNWKAPTSYIRIPNTSKNILGQKIAINTPDKTSSFLIAAHPLRLNESSADYPALLMANHMLGGGALRSRLADRIRQKEGLSYGVGSFISATILDQDATWMAYAMSAPENAAKVEVALREEVQKVLTEGFTESELSDARKAWLQANEVERTHDSHLASLLVKNLKYKRDFMVTQTLENKVSQLSAAQVNEAFRKVFKPEAISIIVASDQAKIKH